MHLTKPTMEYAKSFSLAMEEYHKNHEDGFLNEVGSPQTAAEYVALTRKHEQGRDLPKDWIPYSVFWLIDNNEYIGQLTVRHILTDHLRNVGGHVGYHIRPSKRKLGYGKKLLELALPKIRELGIYKVLITCDESNIASRKIIEHSGGVLEKSNPQDDGKSNKLLYWIKVEQESKQKNS